MNILHIITSPAGENSYSIKLGNGIIEKIKQDHPYSSVVTRDLTRGPLPHYDVTHLSSLFVPIEEHTPELAEVAQRSDEAIAELLHADVIVIGVPMYNYGIPSTLKSWVDYITRAGKTFNYTADGPEGLVTGKKVYLAIATGNVYSAGELKSWDHTESYLRTMLGDFLGMDDIEAVRVEGTAIPGLKETALEKALQSFDEVHADNIHS